MRHHCKPRRAGQPGVRSTAAVASLREPRLARKAERLPGVKPGPKLLDSAPFLLVAISYDHWCYSTFFSPQSEKRKRQTRLTFRALLLWDYMFFPDRLIWTKYSLEIQKLNKLIQKPNLSLRYKTSLCYSQAALEYTNNTPVRNLCHIHFQRRKSILRQIKSEP